MVTANPQPNNPRHALDSGSKQPEIPLAVWVVAGAAAFAAANPRVRRAALGGASMKSGSSAAPQSVWGRRFGYVQAAAIRPQQGPDDPNADARADNEHHDPPASSSTSGNDDGGNTFSGGAGGGSQYTPQSPPAAVSPAPAPAPAPAPTPDVEPTPDPQDEQPSFTLPNYVPPGGDKGIEADPVFFLIDDAAEAAILALLLSAIMATIISEYGWEWVRTHPDQLPDLMIDKLPGWLADQVDKVKDWISQYFTENHDGNDNDTPDRTKPWQGQGDNPPDRPEGVPSDWVPRRSDNGKGWVWQKPGATGNADSVRVMQPDARNPSGYVRIYNGHGQAIDLNGKPSGNPQTHIPIKPDGSFPLPKGWKP
ncbi:hypothetical protein QNM97_25380 [Gordonia sp. L191]|uniref:hypothetical protein n=1 Tax=Gordonia sp. L191 TaxID=2982699 RepID=UPI0024C05597|nr:hypothetical protein [Gordonia sp. L191]WHU47233.1 hypothetical protein QNM97_25380 [Gordonia sp. L191]